MSMNFYIGSEYKRYNDMFEAVRKYVRQQERTKTGSRAETFRWMVDQIFKLVKERLEDKKS